MKRKCFITMFLFFRKEERKHGVQCSRISARGSGVHLLICFGSFISLFSVWQAMHSTQIKLAARINPIDWPQHTSPLGAPQLPLGCSCPRIIFILLEIHTHTFLLIRWVDQPSNRLIYFCSSELVGKRLRLTFSLFWRGLNNTSSLMYTNPVNF